MKSEMINQLNLIRARWVLRRINGYEYSKGKYIDLHTDYAIVKSQDTNTDGGPGSGNFGHKGIPGQVGGSLSEEEAKEQLRSGANPAPKGFASKKLEKIHEKKHASECGCSSTKEYIDLAKDLLSQPVGGDILGYAQDDGFICRFNQKNGIYAKGKPGDIIATCFSPRFDEKNNSSRLDKALAYFETKKAEQEMK